MGHEHREGIPDTKDLKKLEKFSRNTPPQARATVGGGAETMIMKNQNGVVIELNSTTRGASLKPVTMPRIKPCYSKCQAPAERWPFGMAGAASVFLGVVLLLLPRAGTEWIVILVGMYAVTFGGCAALAASGPRLAKQPPPPEAEHLEAA